MTTKLQSRRHFRIEVSDGFLFLLALVFFFDEGSFLPPLFAAAAAHEAGHFAVLYAFGARPAQLKASLSGFSLDYTGSLTDMQTALTALAGPAAGAGFAMLCALLGAETESGFWLVCAGLGVILTLFNLLPVSPLDGGIVAEFALSHLFGAEIACIVSKVLAIAVETLLFGGGLWCLRGGDGPALFLAGVWLLVLRHGGACNRR